MQKLLCSRFAFLIRIHYPTCSWQKGSWKSNHWSLLWCKQTHRHLHYDRHRKYLNLPYLFVHADASQRESQSVNALELLSNNVPYQLTYLSTELSRGIFSERNHSCPDCPVWHVICCREMRFLFHLDSSAAFSAVLWTCEEIPISVHLYIYLLLLHLVRASAVKASLSCVDIWLICSAALMLLLRQGCIIQGGSSCLCAQGFVRQTLLFITRSG